MSAYCDDDITATEPFSQYAAIATPAQLVDLLFAHCHPEQILGVWKLLRECFDLRRPPIQARRASSSRSHRKPTALHPWCAENSKRSRLLRSSRLAFRES